MIADNNGVILLNGDIMFIEDLNIGQRAEEEFVKRLSQIKEVSEVEFNNSNSLSKLREYDVKLCVKGKYHTFEVKLDRLAPKTGNVAVEIKCLSNSKADFFVYSIEDSFYLLPTNSLINLVKTATGRFVWGGDNSNSYMKLLPINIFKNNCVKL